MNPTFDATIGICIAITFLGIFFQIKYTSRTISQGPALLTMLGIAGTFFGIGVGLHSFDPANIQNSIPALISGMQTSVWASFAGIFFAIAIKTRHVLFAKDEIADENVSEAHLIIARLDALQKCVSGDDESTVISQMKLARSDINDRLDAIKRSQEEAMKSLAEMSSKTLVEALRDVIRDFNTKITEQFGDNFKELNIAVSRLVDWQEQYKNQMDALIHLERESVSSMQTAVEHYKITLAASTNLIEVAQSLKSILDTADAYKANLKANTDRIASLVESLRHDIPAVKEQIVGLVKTIEGSVMHSEVEVARIASEVSERFKVAADTVQNELSSALAKANGEILENIKKLVGSTKEQTEQLQVSLEETLNTSLRTLGQQLTSLSGKFVSDYGPITERLREIISIGKVDA